MEFQVKFDTVPEPVSIPAGMLLSEAARLAGLDIMQPCGGQGRCGRCAVQVLEGAVRRRSTLRLSASDVEHGYALACQTVVEGDVLVHVPPQEKIERRLTTDLTVAEVTAPHGYDHHMDQTIRRVRLNLVPPSLEDQTDDLSRVLTALRQQGKLSNISVSLPLLRRMSDTLRQAEWSVTAVLDLREHPVEEYREAWLIDLLPGHVYEDEPLWGIAVDIGTTTVTLWLVDLITGDVRAQTSDYNGQIARGEDVISRIVYAGKNGGSEEMRNLVLDTINRLIDVVCKRASSRLDQSEKPVLPQDIVKATIAGNSTMTHLMLGVPASNIRFAPFVTTVNHVPLLTGQDTGLHINPLGVVDCLPGVASYVGSDITAGVLASGMDDTARITLFLDVGTNGEIVLGSREWLVTCACSAGPAFEGAGVAHGMRATRGAIEEVWVNGETFEPTYRVIGGGKPPGICGSGLLSLLAELFITGVVDKAGNVNSSISIPRVREGDHGGEYIVAWGSEAEDGRDITITVSISIISCVPRQPFMPGLLFWRRASESR